MNTDPSRPRHFDTIVIQTVHTVPKHFQSNWSRQRRAFPRSPRDLTVLWLQGLREETRGQGVGCPPQVEVDIFMYFFFFFFFTFWNGVMSQRCPSSSGPSHERGLQLSETSGETMVR